MFRLAHIVRLSQNVQNKAKYTSIIIGSCDSNYTADIFVNVCKLIS